jgi:hypothetical protein
MITLSKRPTQESVKQEFLRRLARGADVDEAASKAGLNCPETIDQYLDEYAKGQSNKANERLHIEAIQIAISTLKQLAYSGEESDRIRCDAAKALLKFSSDNLRNRSAETAAIVSGVAKTTGLFDFEDTLT